MGVSKAHARDSAVASIGLCAEWQGSNAGSKPRARAMTTLVSSIAGRRQSQGSMVESRSVRSSSQFSPGIRRHRARTLRAVPRSRVLTPVMRETVSTVMHGCVGPISKMLDVIGNASVTLPVTHYESHRLK